MTTAAVDPTTVDITVYKLSEGLKLYAYTAIWCGPCRKIKPTLINLMKNYEQLESTSIEKETFKKDVNVFVPFFKLRKDEKDFKTLQSSNGSELEKFINEAIISDAISSFDKLCDF